MRPWPTSWFQGMIHPRQHTFTRVNIHQHVSAYVIIRIRMLTYAIKVGIGVCGSRDVLGLIQRNGVLVRSSTLLLLTHDDVCWPILTYGSLGRSSTFLLLTHPDVSWRMLTYGEIVCSSTLLLLTHTDVYCHGLLLLSVFSTREKDPFLLFLSIS